MTEEAVAPVLEPSKVYVQLSGLPMQVLRVSGKINDPKQTTEFIQIARQMYEVPVKRILILI